MTASEVTPRRIWMARMMGMPAKVLGIGAVLADDGTARADLYAGGREKFLIVYLIWSGLCDAITCFGGRTEAPMPWHGEGKGRRDRWWIMTLLA